MLLNQQKYQYAMTIERKKLDKCTFEYKSRDKKKDTILNK